MVSAPPDGVIQSIVVVVFVVVVVVVDVVVVVVIVNIKKFCQDLV